MISINNFSIGELFSYIFRLIFYCYQILAGILYVSLFIFQSLFCWIFNCYTTDVEPVNFNHFAYFNPCFIGCFFATKNDEGELMIAKALFQSLFCWMFYCYLLWNFIKIIWGDGNFNPCFIGYFIATLLTTTLSGLTPNFNPYFSGYFIATKQEFVRVVKDNLKFQSLF